MEASVLAEAEAFLNLARQRLSAEGWTGGEWVETGLRAALLRDGRRLLESLLNDPALPLRDDASRPGEKCTAGVSREVETLFGPLIPTTRRICAVWKPLATSVPACDGRRAFADWAAASAW